MKFKVASKALYSVLSGVSKVINSKNTLTILDNFLMKVEEDALVVTASDTENTLTARVAISAVEGAGTFCVNARRLSDIAKELPDVDVDVEVNDDTLELKIEFPGGKFDLVALSADQYPRTVEAVDEAETLSFEAPAEQILNGIENTLFAVGSDDLRPQMMGILWDIKEDGITFVATDTRKLVRYINKTSAPGIAASCIVPVKPSVILKNLLRREDLVKVCISQKAAVFSTENIQLNCCFIKGNFPDYTRVIPKNNPYVVTVDRASILTAVRRVSVCADPAHGLVKFRFSDNKIELKVDDTNFSTFAKENVPCDFQGPEMVIGFSAPYLTEIFSTLATPNVLLQLADPSRPGVFLPEENADNTDLVIILMPMTVQEF
ncbi:MAG: DNA polymerase III subunit beta [Muribaculaceae bacterium]|nr:DNA polymerase III subunit beta [Muribaculaceae bacterium]